MISDQNIVQWNLDVSKENMIKNMCSTKKLLRSILMTFVRDTENSDFGLRLENDISAKVEQIGRSLINIM